MNLRCLAALSLGWTLCAGCPQPAQESAGPIESLIVAVPAAPPAATNPVVANDVVEANQHETPAPTATPAADTNVASSSAADCQREIMLVSGEVACLEDIIAARLAAIRDTDGDGIPNERDPDIDGDSVPNGEDVDVDGDGIPNGSDDDVDGDGIDNADDFDIDGDFLRNRYDLDMDGDLLYNPLDTDADADGLTRFDLINFKSCTAAQQFNDPGDCPPEKCEKKDDQNGGSNNTSGGGDTKDCPPETAPPAAEPGANDAGPAMEDADPDAITPEVEAEVDAILAELGLADVAAPMPNDTPPTTEEENALDETARDITGQDGLVDELRELAPDMGTDEVADAALLAISQALTNDETEEVGGRVRLSEAGQIRFGERRDAIQRLGTETDSDLNEAIDTVNRLDLVGDRLSAPLPDLVESSLMVSMVAEPENLLEAGAAAVDLTQIAVDGGFEAGEVAPSIAATYQAADRLAEAPTGVWSVVVRQVEAYRDEDGQAPFGLPGATQALERIANAVDQPDLGLAEESFANILAAADNANQSDPLAIVQALLADPNEDLADGISLEEATRGAEAVAAQG